MPRGASRIETVTAPGERRNAELPAHEIGSEPCMAAIAIGKGVDLHEAVVIADGQFLGGIAFMREPMGDIAKKLLQTHGYLIWRNADIGFAAAPLSCPGPDIAEHALV